MITFDGPNKIVSYDDAGATVSFTAKDLYSRWKEWLAAGNAQYDTAFRTIGGDPLGGAVTAGDYYFLNNVAGWRIRPKEAAHELVIVGNLYGEDPGIAIFAPTVGNFNVQTRLSLSSLTQVVATGSGLTPTEQAKLDEIHKLHGLDATAPLVVTPTSRDAGAGISQTITDVAGTVTVERQ